MMTTLTPPAAGDLIAEGRGALDRGDPAAAAQVLRRACEQNPVDYESRYWLYCALAASGEPAALVLNDARDLHAHDVLRSVGADMARFRDDRAYCAQIGSQLYGASLMSAASICFARALDLCQFTVDNPPSQAEKVWGVISATLTETDGSPLLHADQAAVRDGFGANNPTGFDSLVVLSSGVAADLADQNPAFSQFEGGQNWGSDSPPPADWYAANGNAFPNAPGCPAGATTSNDPVMLTLRIRVPTNAQSFSSDLNFFSAEFPEWVCSLYTDMFVALIDSNDPANPADKNIAVYDDGVDQWPLGVNLARSAAGLFSQCLDGVVGCSGTTSNYAGCAGVDQLIGTGFDAYDSYGAFDPGCIDDPGSTAGHYYKGGATGWLTMSGNVEPGEIIEVRLAVWDAGGHIYDSLVVLDNWSWDLDAAVPGLTPG